VKRRREIYVVLPVNGIEDVPRKSFFETTDWPPSPGCFLRESMLEVSPPEEHRTKKPERSQQCFTEEKRLGEGLGGSKIPAKWRGWHITVVSRVQKDGAPGEGG